MRILFTLSIVFFLGCGNNESTGLGTAPDGAFGGPGTRSDASPSPNPDISTTPSDSSGFGEKDSEPASDTLPPTDITPDATISDSSDGTSGPPDTSPKDTEPPPPDVPFEDPDTGCAPDCDGKECGSDECGSICGFCQYGTACSDTNACIPICDPVTPCTGKVCGPDGCGGTCGDCQPSFACGADGLCYESDCEPQCEDKECGPDLCGGVCGTCKGFKLCDTDAGECVANPCGSISFKGACADKYTVVQCVGGALEFSDCALENEGWGCVWDPFDAVYECGTLPDCTPDCTGKQCGDGGCSYLCGDCFEGWSCVNFTCVPEVGGDCGTIPGIGTCIDNKVYFCSGGTIYVEDCEAAGKTCKFDVGLGKTTCD